VSERSPSNDDSIVSSLEPVAGDGRTDLLALYDRMLPQVYGYLLARVHQQTLAEDLTAETFLAAVEALDRRPEQEVSAGWLITVARNKLVDHWRRQAREERSRHLTAAEDAAPDATDRAVEEKFERARARAVLDDLRAHHRAALTLRYVDDLSVPEVADHLGRTVHATEALLVRARNAFRARYDEGGCDAG
jgi:RNA polymerase sigma-70 factor (ECF subfamily)